MSGHELEEAWARFMPLLPVLSEIIEQNSEWEPMAPFVVTPAQFDVLKTYYEAELAKLVVAQELIEWAIMNAPPHLVENLARVGLIE